MSEEKESIPSPELPEGSPNSSNDESVIQQHVTPYEPVITDPDTASDNEMSEPGSGSGMNFMEHLEEIRSRLIKSAIALVVVTGICANYSDFLVNDILIAPLTRSSKTVVLQNLVPYGQLSLYLQVVVFSAFIISFPFLAWQIWQFVAPGLHENERKAGRFSILFISLSFFTGIGKIGLLTPAFMRFYRKHAIVFLLVVAAIVTPSTDIVTQLVIGVPMILLYELSILISAHVNRKNNALKM